MRDRDVLTLPTNSAELYVYHVGNLTENCHDEVTAIEYCYQYNSGGGEDVFNWTVLILESEPGSRNFQITNIHVIESHRNAGNCVNVSGGIPQMKCCIKSVNGFVLPMNFAFGVTGSAQGNTHGAMLLGFHWSLSQYDVNTAQIPRSVVEQRASITVGSMFTLEENQFTNGSLRMLWFVVGM